MRVAWASAALLLVVGGMAYALVARPAPQKAAAFHSERAIPKSDAAKLALLSAGKSDPVANTSGPHNPSAIAPAKPRVKPKATASNRTKAHAKKTKTKEAAPRPPRPI